MINRKLTDFHFKDKHFLLRFADSINSKSIYPLWKGRKVTFINNDQKERDYIQKEYKTTFISVIFFLVISPLLPITMAIKCWSKENKLAWQTMAEIDQRKARHDEEQQMIAEEAKLQTPDRQGVKKRKDIAVEQRLKENNKRRKLKDEDKPFVIEDSGARFEEILFQKEKESEGSNIDIEAGLVSSETEGEPDSGARFEENSLPDDEESVGSSDIEADESDTENEEEDYSLMTGKASLDDTNNENAGWFAGISTGLGNLFWNTLTRFKSNENEDASLV